MAQTGGINRVATAAAAALVGLVALRKGSSEAGRERDEKRARESEPSRGRDARSPTDIPSAGWKDILWRTYEQLSRDRVMLIAAGVTFYAILALFPAMTAFISIYGLFADPETVVGHVRAMEGVLPGGAVEIVGGQMESLAQQPSGSLGFGFAIGLAIALWSANNGMKAIIDAMNVAYNEGEGRSFIRLTMVSFMFTLGAIALLIIAMGAIVVLPIVLGFIGDALGGTIENILNVARWPLLLLIVIFAISVLYRYGPNRERAEWRWVTPGSLLASVVWIIASIGFSWYVSNFGTYNETYGSLGAIIGFMVWMWISATIIIMGAELNSEMEHQTKRDSTTGRSLPMGARGAVVADELGERRG
ncbi:MAG TPA: YihY/virulence factor BrkB family protein [Saliniramus sp.]|nr:YihY/virulence factor BrkB family protein [Saliniramus sp.]